MGRKGKAVVLDHGRLLRQTREMNSKIDRERKKSKDALETNISALHKTVASLAKEIKHVGFDETLELVVVSVVVDSLLSLSLSLSLFLSPPPPLLSLEDPCPRPILHLLTSSSTQVERYRSRQRTDEDADRKVLEMRQKLNEAKATLAELQDKAKGHTVEDLIKVMKQEKKLHEKEVRSGVGLG